MYDGWTRPSRLSIINFLMYCDKKMFFHKSIDASSTVHDMHCILKLIEDMINEIGFGLFTYT